MASGFLRQREQMLHELRRLLPQMEGLPAAGVLPFGVSALDNCLPQGGLCLGALHEICPAEREDRPAALGFAAALLGRLSKPAPVVLVLPRGFLGCPYGHGLGRLGLDPSRLLLVETKDERETLWAMEEALRSAAPAGVAGIMAKGCDLRASQRLHLAAERSGLLLLLLRPVRAPGSSVAATRWRIGSAPAACDRFGLIAPSRWHVALERCRNGRLGEWVLEFDHAYRFRLAAPMADSALPHRTATLPRARAG
jgi:protein ImuA